MTDENSFTQKQVEVYELLPSQKREIAEKLDVNKSTVEGYFDRINEKDEVSLIWEEVNGEYIWYDENNSNHEISENTSDENFEENERQDLTDREEYIYRSLPESVENLADDLNVNEKVIETHLSVIEDKGWSVEDDNHGNYLGPDQDHLRSSEHKQTRTRKANRWWQRRHDQLVHEFQELDNPIADASSSDGNEDWVLHLTDLHVGDKVRRDDGRVVYDTDKAVDYVDYITRRSLSLADKHGSDYDTCYLLWGGDMVTNEGIYEGQFEDLDSWLDEQLETAAQSLIEQVVAHAQKFNSVEIIAQIGNHGDMRASATSKQANADLILYKWVRNVIANVRKWAEEHPFNNVGFRVGEAKNYRNFTMRDGRVRGHLRHGDDAKPQAQTASGRDKWGSWQSNWQFDVAYCGHFHTSKREDAKGKPVLFSGSPKPPAEYAERLGVQTDVEPRDIATCHGVSDEGVTAVFPIDTRFFPE